MASRRIAAGASHFPPPKSSYPSLPSSKYSQHEEHYDNDEDVGADNDRQKSKPSTRKRPAYERRATQDEDSSDEQAPPRRKKPRTVTPPERSASDSDASPRRSRSNFEDPEFEQQQQEEEEEVEDALSPHVKSLSRQRRKTRTSKPKSRSRVSAGVLDKTDQRIYDHSRGLARFAHPFISFRGVIDIKLDELDARPINAQDIRYLKTYDILALTIPELDSLLANRDYDRLDYVTKIMQDAANQAKHADTALLRDLIGKIIPLEENSHVVPSFDAKLKADRGFTHPQTRLMLTAQDRFNELSDPEFVKQVKNGVVAFTFEDHPALMFDQAKADSEDREAGLFEGHVPIRTLRAILHGKKHVYTPTRVVKNSNADRQRIKYVTGRLIAYAHVQVRCRLHAQCKLTTRQAYFACTTAEKWTDKVGTFDLRDWYDDMVEMFEEDEEDEKMVEILAFWTDQIFGAEHLQNVTNTAPTRNPNSSAAQLKALRIARKHARADAARD
ncbi:hypothetical protein C8F01DRAFT_1374197 [Mycena amicta]|nr:hypothetical protein C8F01DRAFT_1374197 [Mycena amicta]